MSHSSAIPLQPEVGGLGAGASFAMERHNSDPDVSSKPGSYSCEKRAMAFEDLSSRLPSKLSRRRAMSQAASPVVDFHVAIAEKPYNFLQGSQLEEEPKSYYIINPRVPGLAWYLTRNKSNSNAHEYEVERVPAHLVHIRQNRIGYLLETAIRDDVTGAAGGRPVSWTPKCQNGWSTASISSIEKAGNGTEEEPGKRVNRFERCDLEEDIETQLHNESSIVMECRDIPTIAKRIIRQLHAAGLKETHLCMTKDCAENDEEPSKEKMELENAIKATLMEFRRSVQRKDTPETDNGDASPQSKLLARLGNKNQRIKLRPSGVADPALTLSIPQTSFTAAGSNNKHNGTKEKWQREAPTWTSVVSPQSVTSITWTKQGGHLGEPSPDSTDSSSDENSENTENTVQTHRAPFCRDDDQSQELETSQASIGSSSIASTMTSFPKLLSRHCTREWIKPLTSLEDTSTDIIYQGVDTGTYRPSRHQQVPFTETSTPPCRPGDGFESTSTSSYFTNEAANSRRTTVSQPSLTNPKNFGTQIGSAAHRRRSAPAHDLKTPPPRDRFFPNFFGKLFVYRSREASGSPDSKKAIHSHDHTPMRSPASENGSFTRRASAVSVEDSVRIYDVLVEGNAAEDRRRQRDTCSEDSRPHICEDDLNNRVMTA